MTDDVTSHDGSGVGLAKLGTPEMRIALALAL